MILVIHLLCFVCILELGQYHGLYALYIFSYVRLVGIHAESVVRTVGSVHTWQKALTEADHVHYAIVLVIYM